MGVLMAGSFSDNYSGAREPRLLAAGGIHVFESQAPCALLHAQPEGTVKDLGLADPLALEAGRGRDHGPPRRPGRATANRGQTLTAEDGRRLLGGWLLELGSHLGRSTHTGTAG